MNALAKSAFTRAELVFGLVLVSLLFVLLTAAHATMRERGVVTKSIANCRQVIIAIRMFGADEGGRYPDAADPATKAPAAKDSNMAFRRLIVAKYLEDEKCFGCEISRFLPDGVIGSAPHYARAVEPDENHWAMTKDLTDSSPNGIPLVYENPIEASWPPKWKPDAAEVPIKGRTWRGGKVLIGTNDTSIELWKLEAKVGAKVGLKPFEGTGFNVFSQWGQAEDAPKYKVLDIAR